MSLLGKLFRKSDKDESGERHNPRVVAAIKGRAGEEEGPHGAALAFGEDMEREFEEFSRTFCYKPGANFMEYLRSEDAWRMERWLNPNTEEAEPRAFIRLMLDMMRMGENIWSQPGLTFLRDARGATGSAPKETQDAISVLSQILGIPITLYYRERPDSPLMVLEFQP